MLTPLHIIFYIFAAIAVISATSVITVKNPVRSVLSLVVTFFAMSGIWMLLRAEFLSLILLLVYVGAVMTLFLFVVMMLNIDVEGRKSGFVRYLPFGVVVVLLMVGLLIAAVGPQYFGLTQMPAPLPEPANFSNTQQVGAMLYTDYVYPFEVAGVLLLAAIIAAITLTHRKPKLPYKSQRIDSQLAANPKSRLHLIKMPPTPKQGAAE
jgi:NADH-quinone oxidoreductase subunit J